MEQEELKFRAWDKDRKSMSPVMTISEWLFDAFQQAKQFGNEEDEVRGFFEKIIFLQFTGIKDRDGKEVFDRDIVSILLNGPEKDPCTRIVVRKFTGFYVEVTSGDYVTLHRHKENILVIGNTLENPELIK